MLKFAIVKNLVNSGAIKIVKNLVIVESPAKAKTISKFLGNDYTVMASMGHVRDLPKSKLGFDPDNNFEPKYIVSTDKKKVITDLKKQINKDTTIYLAADEDREVRLLLGI